MTFPRISEVAKHLARKPRRSWKLQAEIIPVEEVPNTDLKVLAEDLSAAVRSANNSIKPGDQR